MLVSEGSPRTSTLTEVGVWAGFSLSVRLRVLLSALCACSTIRKQTEEGHGPLEDPRRQLTFWRDLPVKGMAGPGRIPSAPSPFSSQRLPQPELLTVWAWVR